jgi:hypothetical protein
MNHDLTAQLALQPHDFTVAEIAEYAWFDALLPVRDEDDSVLHEKRREIKYALVDAQQAVRGMNSIELAALRQRLGLDEVAGMAMLTHGWLIEQAMARGLAVAERVKADFPGLRG